MSSNTNDSESKKEVDIFRDTPIRYMGYANEVGEAFRAMVPVSVVRASYAVAFGYVFMDVIDKAKKTYRKECLKQESAPKNQQNADSPTVKTAKIATDCLLWQTFASVLIPGFTINRICYSSSLLLRKSTSAFILKNNKLITTAIGLLSIPVIIHPIDHFCHQVMDSTVRPALGIEPYLKKTE